jgi:hypothetical protein
MTPRPVLEVVLFKLKPNVEETAFLEASEAIMPDLRAMQGFIHRELHKDAESRWMDTVQWQSLDEAQRAAQVLIGLPCAQALFAMLDGSSVTILHLEPVRTY